MLKRKLSQLNFGLLNFIVFLNHKKHQLYLLTQKLLRMDSKIRHIFKNIRNLIGVHKIKLATFIPFDDSYFLSLLQKFCIFIQSRVHDPDATDCVPTDINHLFVLIILSLFSYTHIILLHFLQIRLSIQLQR